MGNVTGDKLTHMQHTEDLVLFGKAGCDLMMDGLEDTIRLLTGEQSSRNISMKFDGSMAVYAASDLNGMMLVSPKAIFNKNPKFATTESECFTEFGEVPEKALKLSYVVKDLDKIGIPSGELWQGDLLFIKSDLREETINGQDYILFHPNTIVYAVKKGTDVANQILSSQWGIVWHTVYEGHDLTDLHLSGRSASVSNVNEVKGVFQIDASLRNLKTRGNYSADETLGLRATINKIKDKISSLESNPLYEGLCSQGKITDYMNQYRNKLIRENRELEGDFEGFSEWLRQYLMSKSTAKTEAGILKNKQKVDELISTLGQFSDVVNTIYEVQRNVVGVKESLTNKLNSFGVFNTFVEYSDGTYIPCSNEGIVIGDSFGNLQKFVNRKEFSRNNFDPNIVKGWTSDKRRAEGTVTNQ